MKRFKIGEPVKIEHLGLIGRVRKRTYSAGGQMVFVEFRRENGTRGADYFIVGDVEKITEDEFLLRVLEM